MKIIQQLTILSVAFLLGCSGTNNAPQAEPTLKEALKNKFYIGTALNLNQINGTDTAGVRVIKQQFDAIVAENCMKSQEIQPEEGVFTFSEADKFVEFGEANNMFITGHTLIWHSQLSKWFCIDENGNNVSPEILTERMRTHIHTVVGRYKGRIKGWDVVNEAIMDNGSWRNSKFYEILGEDFMKLAFQFAHEADPDAELYYNDYSMAIPAKREGVIKMIRSLQEQGIRIDAVGMQGHIGMDYPQIDEFEKSILAFAATGVKVMITELDLTILPNAHTQNAGAEISDNFEYRQEIDPYSGALPEDVSCAWNARMLDFFKLFLKHQDKITRVTLWGVADGDSWRNDWPVPGRTDYALLFDRNHQPKPVVHQIISYAE